MFYVVLATVIPGAWTQAQRQGIQLPHIPPGSLVQVGKSGLYFLFIPPLPAYHPSMCPFTFSKIFFSGTSSQIKAKFYMKHP